MSSSKPEKEKDKDKDKDKAKTHKLSLKGSSKLVAEFFEYSINTILFQRGVYPPEDFTAQRQRVKKYGLNMLVTSDDQVKAYIKKIMSQLNKWMVGGKISKLVIVITSKDIGEHVERWQFDVEILGKPSTSSSSSKSKSKPSSKPTAPSPSQDAENQPPQTTTSTTSNQQQTTASVPPTPTEAEIQSAIQAIFRQITASVTFLPSLDAQGACTFNVLVYADADSEVPLEWGDSDAKEVEGGEKVALRSFSTGSHRVGAVVSYRVAD